MKKNPKVFLYKEIIKLKKKNENNWTLIAHLCNDEEKEFNLPICYLHNWTTKEKN